MYDKAFLISETEFGFRNKSVTVCLRPGNPAAGMQSDGF